MIRSSRVLIGAVGLSLACTIVAAPSSFAQSRAVRTTVGSVPAQVLHAFQDAYPKAEIQGMASLTEGGKVMYEIECVDGETSRKVEYLADGELVAVSEEVTKEGLPGPVTKAVEDKYPGAVIVKSVSNTRGGATTYLLKVVAGGRRITMVLNPDGSLVRAKDTGGGARKP